MLVVQCPLISEWDECGLRNDLAEKVDANNVLCVKTVDNSCLVLLVSNGPTVRYRNTYTSEAMRIIGSQLMVFEVLLFGNAKSSDSRHHYISPSTNLTTTVAYMLSWYVCKAKGFARNVPGVLIVRQGPSHST